MYSVVFSIYTTFSAAYSAPAGTAPFRAAAYGADFKSKSKDFKSKSQKSGLYACFFTYTVRLGVLPALLTLFLAGGKAGALDLTVRAKPYFTLPLGVTKNNFDAGGGLDLNLDIDLSSIPFLSNPLFIGYTAGPEAGIGMIHTKADDMGTLFFGGLNASLFYYPVSRLSFRLGGTFGFYQASDSEGNTYANTMWKYGAEIGFRFSPQFTLSVNGGLRQYNYRPEKPTYQGIYMGLTGQILFDTSRQDDGVSVTLKQDEPLLPIFAGLYRQNSIGTLRIVNNESAEIRNISVSFRAGGYTSSEILCGQAGRLGKRKTAEIPLIADFSSQILNFSESGRISGEVIVRYEILGSPKNVAGTALVEVYNRNSYRWGDSASLAVFVSPSAPETLDYQKYMVGIARNHIRTGLNRNMQNAMYLYEGLRVGGIKDSGDQQTPYATYHKDPALLDYIQFPFQTLAYRSGDLDELGILFAASLEAAGIKAALIPLENDFIVAFSLGIDEAQASSFFYNLDGVLVKNDEVWMPVAFSSFRDGFINSWYTAVNAVGTLLAEGGDMDFIVLEDAWKTYPPAAVMTQEAQFDKPPEENVARVVDTDIARYIVAELGPKIQELRDTIRIQGEIPSLLNQLGLLYIRSGMFNEAKTEYLRSASQGSVAAMVNLGNLAMLDSDAVSAERWFSQALRADPSNRGAADGLNQIAINRQE
jgi:hypothetical protein